MRKSIKKATFLGGADFVPESQVYKNAFETAKLLAEEGITILNGGGPGIMRAATEGAHAAGGRAIGITYYPGYKHSGFEGKDPKNELDEEIKTDNYFERTRKLLEMGDVHIIFKGGTGTISEFGMSWASSRIHYGHNIPLILFGEFWREIIETFRKYMYMRPDEFKVYYIVNSPREVLENIKAFHRTLTIQNSNV